MTTITMTKTLPDGFLSDVLITAFDGSYGGCWYWAKPDLRRNDGRWLTTGPDGTWQSCLITLDPEGSTSCAERLMQEAGVLVNHDVIAQGITKALADGRYPSINEAVLTVDAGCIDADDADVIVQLAVFGEVVYG